MRLTLKHLLIILGLFLGLSFKAIAGTEPYENFLKGAIKKNDSLMVKDEKFKNPLFNWSEITNSSVHNTISLKILDHLPIANSFRVKMTVQIEYFSDPTQVVPTKIDSVSLNVNYVKGGLSPHQLLAIFPFENGYQVKVKVLDIVSPELGNNLPEIFQLTSSIVINRTYLFKPFLKLNMTGTIEKANGGKKKKGGALAKFNGDSSSEMENDDHMLKISWPIVPGADFDLEWTAIDLDGPLHDIAQDLYDEVDVPDDSLAKVFRNNATRVTLSENKYHISLMYNSDVVLLRMRQVFYDNDGIRLEGDWDYRKSDNSVAAWPLTWHQSNLNWQYSSAFAEEGKKKEVVSYFDGTLRGRQTVTINNSDNVAVVQENIYDQFGRAAASILPAPVKVATIDSIPEYLHYFTKFNRNGANLPYSFSNLNATNCEPLPDSLSVSSGAAKYYSSNNLQFINTTLYNKYIPDAGGYPLSVTQYTADNTGRIKVQGGVGLTFQPGTGSGTEPSHTTKYYYGKPEQYEIDKLFGNDVGYASHYLKNMVIDPNGQISVSYLNAAGKTIATALAGSAPKNLDSLSTADIAKTETNPIFTPSQFTFSGSDLKLTATTTIMVTVPDTTAYLNYNIENLVSRYPNTTSWKPCFNCFYQLTITVKDDCQDSVYLNKGNIKLGSDTSKCIMSPNLTPDLGIKLKKVGTYYITYEFELSKDLIDSLEQVYVDSGEFNGHLKKRVSFITDYLNGTAFAECYSDCSTARKRLGTLSAFTDVFNAKLVLLGENPSNYSELIEPLYDAIITKITALEATCATSPCDRIKIKMLADVSPGGQFALFDESGNPLETGINVIYNTFRDVFPVNNNGSPIPAADVVELTDDQTTSPYAADFTVANLVAFWQPEWAEKFLAYHPEYCKLEFCYTNDDSNQFDDQLKSEADPTALASKPLHAATYSNSSNTWLLSADPFFNGSGIGAAYYSDMLNDIAHYSRNFLKINEIYGSSIVEKTLSQSVDYQLYCARPDWTTNTTAGSADDWTNCSVDSNCRVPAREWELYREAYLDLKERYVNMVRAATTCEGVCDVGVTPCEPLTLSSSGIHVSANVYTDEDTGAGTTTTYTFIAGDAEHPPTIGEGCNRTFYPCITVQISGSDGHINFTNVWLVTCVATTGCPTIDFPSGTSVSTTFTYNGDTYHFIADDPAYPEGPGQICGEEEDQSATVFYPCITLTVDGVATVTYYDVWLVICYNSFSRVAQRSSIASNKTSSFWTKAFEKPIMANKKGISDADAAAIFYAELLQHRVKNEYLVPAADNTIYSIIKTVNDKTLKSKSLKNQPETKAGFYSYQFKEEFKVPTSVGGFVIMKNIWLANFIPETGSAKAQPPIVKAKAGKAAAKGFGIASFAGIDCALLVGKISHFGRVDILGANPMVDTAQYRAEQQAQLTQLIADNCLGSANAAIDRLTAGLDVLGATDTQRTYLRDKLAELCAKGGSISNVMGTSTIPTSTPVVVSGANCYTFGDVILHALSISNYTPLLNPWLIDSPYPHTTKHVAAETIVSNSNADLCTRLSTLKGSITTTSAFYTHLVSSFGSSMTLTEAELGMLEKSCSTCKYLVEKDIKLPVFLMADNQCVTRTALVADTAYAQGLIPGLSSASPNYQTIIANYLNHKYGYSFSYDRYRSFALSSDSLLCNELPYTSTDADNYDCMRSLIELAVGNGKRDYDAYIAIEREKFRNAYVSTCAAAKAEGKLTNKQRNYHYTLYYYDLAGNLVRTVPPEGVTFLTNNELTLVQKARDFNPDACSYNGPDTAAIKATALQKLSDVVDGSNNNAIEMWVYSNNTQGRQFIAATPDMKYMVQSCINGSLVSVDIFSLTQATSGDVSIVHSNHVTANVAALNPLSPWMHVVVQGDSLATGALEIWVNGIQYAPVSGSPTAGCPWQISTDPLHMPENLGTLKHLRLYSGRLMTGTEILANATNSCFAAYNLTNLSWYRFNLPDAGDATTIAYNSTRETQYSGVYPLHTLPTTYAYNSTNQVSQQKTPDAGTSRFWYDYLSRLVVSQNAKQLANGDYSYTKYDVLGRITEVGQKHIVDTNFVASKYVPDVVYGNFLAGGTNSQLTQTIYDVAPTGGSGGIPTGLTLQNLRKRVAASIYRETPLDTSINASYYSYDISGNVKRLYQQVYGLGLKTLDYEYDLVSGKVNFLAYQKGKHDQFYYEYRYDAENRLTQAWSAVEADTTAYGFNSTLTDPYRKLDASYEYYLHGPLARMELGDLMGKVQGTDYAYTLQGWLKGVNGNMLNDPSRDIGNDGASIGRDALAYSLGYYDGDYAPIGGSTYTALGKTYQQTPTDITGRSLYNGNISTSTYAIAKINSGTAVGYTYGYDQLNRLKNVRQHGLAGTWNNASAADTAYKESFAYDGNGNILKLLRNKTGGTNMDNLAYAYNRDGNGRLINNRLKSVTDASSDTETGQLNGTSSYTYDQIGNLIKDSKEGITNIDWTVYGKIKSIDKTGTANDITYRYDPSGNRVAKTINGKSTWYVRDAQGNQLAVYDNVDTATKWREQDLYGSSRLGMWKPNINLALDSGANHYSAAGNKFFELNNHLGNVMVVINDNRTLASSIYSPVVINAHDYYAFGSQMVGRGFDTLNVAYRYGFNGKENDNEVKGEANSVDFGARIYDSRIGRWLSVDPLQQKYPSISPYNFAMNNPQFYYDIDGRDVGVTITRNPNGGGSIVFYSTTYVTGVDASEKVKIYNEAFTKFIELNPDMKSKDGKWNVTFKMEFKVAEDKDIQRIANNKQSLVAENMIKIDIPNKNKSRAGTGMVPNSEDLYYIGQEYASKRFAQMFTNNDGRTAIHETLHNWGLGDYYADASYLFSSTREGSTNFWTPPASYSFKGFEGTIMGVEGFCLPQQSVDDFVNAALKKSSEKKSDNFVMGTRVDSVETTGNNHVELIPQSKSVKNSTFTNTYSNPKYINAGN